MRRYTAAVAIAVDVDVDVDEMNECNMQ